MTYFSGYLLRFTLIDLDNLFDLPDLAEFLRDLVLLRDFDFGDFPDLPDLPDFPDFGNLADLRPWGVGVLDLLETIPYRSGLLV